jgi:hypothetical protein
VRKRSFADLIKDWESLLRAGESQGERLAGSAAQRAALGKQLALVKATKATQDSARATLQASTQQLDKQIEEGQMMAIQLRSAIRSLLDPRSEGLVEFGIAPLRSRSSRVRSANLNRPGEAPQPSSGTAGPNGSDPDGAVLDTAGPDGANPEAEPS